MSFQRTEREPVASNLDVYILENESLLELEEGLLLCLLHLAPMF